MEYDPKPKKPSSTYISWRADWIKENKINN